jgi:dihydroorotate dehydrogenase
LNTNRKVGSVLYPLTRSLLFRLDPEVAHELSLGVMRRVGAVPAVRAAVAAAFSTPPDDPVEAFGLTFRNRIGLAAGYDKDGDAWRGLTALGFGHIEVGTVTPGPQPGNRAPRVFRLVEQRSLINRMGFPGRGAAYVAQRLRGSRPAGVVLGVNIGKQKSTPLLEAARDYQRLMEVFAPLADYLAVNISSPNTPELRRLQETGYLEDLLDALSERRRELAHRLRKQVPVLIKIAPDLDDEQLKIALAAIQEREFDGVIATNTTIARSGVDHPLAGEEGGLSGAALTAASTDIIHKIHTFTGGALPIVGVGGVMGPEDAQEKLDAGATLIQVYTGLVYEGPGLVSRILKALDREAVGQ